MTAETDKLLHHADVLKVILAVLTVYGMRGEAKRDGSQEVLTRAFAAKGKRPETVEEWKRLIRKVASRYGIDELRKRKTWEKLHVDVPDQADAYSSAANYRPRWDERDARKGVDLLWMMMDEGLLPKDFDVFLDGISAGVSQRELALEAGMPEELYTKQQWRGRQRFMAKLSAVGLAGLMVVGAFFFVFIYVDPNRIAHHGTDVLADAGPPGPGGGREPLPPQVMVDTHKAEVAKLRAQIGEAASAKDWKKCMTLYVALDSIEPEDPTDQVKRACENGLSADLIGKARGDAGKTRSHP